MGLFFTARKQSLGQGNVFTCVCHSVHKGEGGVDFPASITGHMTRGSVSRGDLHLGEGGLHLGEGVYTQGKEVCM